MLGQEFFDASFADWAWGDQEKTGAKRSLRLAAQAVGGAAMSVMVVTGVRTEMCST